MNYQCTRNSAEQVSAAQAIAQGISGDGGLFVPENLPQYDSSVLEELRDGTYLPVSYTHLDVYKRQPLRWTVP